MPASLDSLETAVQAAVQAMIDCKAIPSESVSAVWSDSGHKELEPRLRGSLLIRSRGHGGWRSALYYPVSLLAAEDALTAR